MALKQIGDVYLGDGVYASFDGFCIILDLRGQDDTTRIALEPSVLHNLAEFQKDIAAPRKELEPQDKEDIGGGISG